MLQRSASSLLQASLLPLALLYWVLPPGGRAWLDIPCLFTAIFGVHCPGCGMKSAIVRLLNLDWHGAVAINPLAPFALAALTWASIDAFRDIISKGEITRDRVLYYRATDDGEGAVA